VVWRMSPKVCDPLPPTMPDADITDQKGVLPPGAIESVLAVEAGFSDTLYKSIGSSTERANYSGSINDFCEEVLEGVAMAELIEISIIHVHSSAGAWVKAGITHAYDSNSATKVLATRMGNLNFTANAMNVGIKQVHVFEIPGNISTYIRPTSGMKPMLRLQIESSGCDVLCVVKFKVHGGRIWSK
jgi:hypothetical protein